RRPHAAPVRVWLERSTLRRGAELSSHYTRWPRPRRVNIFAPAPTTSGLRRQRTDVIVRLYVVRSGVVGGGPRVEPRLLRARSLGDHHHHREAERRDADQPHGEGADEEPGDEHPD